MALPTPPRILAVRFSSIGDIILITPLLRALRTRHPDAYLAVVTKSAYAELLADNPRINHLVLLDEGSGLGALARELRSLRFTHLLDLHGNLRSRLLRAMVPGNWHGYPKFRLARSLLIHWKVDRYPGRLPVAERYFAAADGLDVTPDGQPPELLIAPQHDAAAGRWLAERGIGQARQLVALSPGAAHATKRWPAERWRELVLAAQKLGNDVVLVGGPGDRKLCAGIVAGLGPTAVDASGAFGLQGTAALLTRSAALVSGDTGVMHLATAVGTPVVALFGPTVEQFGFFPYRSPAVLVERNLPCRPCSSHGTEACPLGHHHCLTGITAEEVESALVRATA